MIPISPGELLARVAPDVLDSLPPDELAAALFNPDLWLRPAQRIPRRRDWRSYTFLAGRGCGKTFGIACEINRRVEAGECRAPILMAPNDDRVLEVQVANLISTAPPWFRPEPYRGGCRWPNGVVALAFTPEAPGRPRSENADLAWMTELVDWKESTRREAFNNVTTACRIAPAQYFIDTTSKGKHELILEQVAACKADPRTHILVRGTMFDNPLFSRIYLRAEVAKYVKGSRRYDEEILGLEFAEAAGALWQQAWIDAHRRPTAPKAELSIIALDPALSDRPDSDETGIVKVCRDSSKHIHITHDFSDRLRPIGDDSRRQRGWVDIVIDECARDCAGVVVERNHLGDNPSDLIKVAARLREPPMRVEILEKKHPEEPFPPRCPGVIYIRERVARSSKESRAEAPAALYQAGRVHHVGLLEQLEHQLTTWIPGNKSPNRLDAAVYGVAELAGINLEDTASTTAALAAAAKMQAALKQHTATSPARDPLRAGLLNRGRRFGI